MPEIGLLSLAHMARREALMMLWAWFRQWRERRARVARIRRVLYAGQQTDLFEAWVDYCERKAAAEELEVSEIRASARTHTSPGS